MDHPLASDSLLVDGCTHVEVPDVKPRDTYIVVRACMRPLPRSIPRVYDYEAPLTLMIPPVSHPYNPRPSNFLRASRQRQSHRPLQSPLVSGLQDRH